MSTSGPGVIVEPWNQKTVMANDDLGFPCDFCKKIFATEDDLFSHITADDNEECNTKDIIDTQIKIEQNLHVLVENEIERIKNMTNSRLNKQKGMSELTELNEDVQKSRNKNYKDFYKKSETIFICIKCETTYQSQTGIQMHLKKTTCGFGEMEAKNPRANHTSFYSRDERGYVCDTCKKTFQSGRGIYYHISKTKCSYQEKNTNQKRGKQIVVLDKKQTSSAKEGKQMYRSLYYRNGDHFVCKTCDRGFESGRGIHYHLNKTLCGFGEKDAKETRQNYLGLYTKDEGLYTCINCDSTYMSDRGIYSHLNRTHCGPQAKEEGTNMDTGHVDQDNI